MPYYVLIILILGLHTLSYRFPACIIPHVRSRSLTKYSQFADDVSIHKRTMRFSSTCVSEWEKTTTIEPTSASDDGIDVEPSASVASVASVNSILAEKFIMMYTCKLCQYRNTNMVSRSSNICKLLVYELILMILLTISDLQGGLFQRYGSLHL